MTEALPELPLAPLDGAAVIPRIRDLFNLYGNIGSLTELEGRIYDVDSDTGAVSTQWNEDIWSNVLRLDHDGLSFTRIAGAQADIPGDRFELELPAYLLTEISEIEEFSSQL